MVDEDETQKESISMENPMEEMQERKFEKMSDETLVQICNSELSVAINGLADDNEISEQLDYYLGRKPGLTRVEQKDPKASRIVSMDLMDAVEATTAEIMQMFSGDEIAYFQPESAEDEQQAREESDIVNYQFLEEYDGYISLQGAVKDCLLHRNGVLKVYWDKRVLVEYETLDNVPENQLQQYLAPRFSGEEVEIIEQYVDGEQIEQGAAPIPDGSVVAVQTAVQTYSFKLKRARVIQKPVVECVPPEQLRICPEHYSPYLQDVRFAAHEKIETQSSLIEQGFDADIVKNLPTYSYSANITDQSRSRNVSEIDYGATTNDQSTRPILVSECYMLIDYDGDGVAERRKVLIAENTLLSNEEIDYVCLIGGVGTLMPHKWQGISLFDRLQDIQDGKTDLLRAIVNGAKLAANPRTGAVTGAVNIEDLLMSRTGGIVRADRPDAVFPLPNPEVPPSVFNTMTFLDSIRRQRGGSAIDTAAQAQDIAGDTAHGIERTMSAIELYNSMVARTIGETLVRGVFLALHRLLRKYHQGPMMAQVGGRWIQSVPSEWPARSKVAVQLGSSVNERNRQAAVMMRVIDMHRELHQMQAPLVDISKSYRAITDAIRLAGIKSPERYFIDPQSEEGQKAMANLQKTMNDNRMKSEAMQLGMLQAEQKLAQAEEIKAVSQQQNAFLKAENERLKAQIQSIKNDADMALQAQQISNDFSLGVTKLEMDNNRELSRAIEANR